MKNLRDTAVRNAKFFRNVTDLPPAFVKAHYLLALVHG